MYETSGLLQSVYCEGLPCNGNFSPLLTLLSLFFLVFVFPFFPSSFFPCFLIFFNVLHQNKYWEKNSCLLPEVSNYVTEFEVCVQSKDHCRDLAKLDKHEDYRILLQIILHFCPVKSPLYLDSVLGKCYKIFFSLFVLCWVVSVMWIPSFLFRQLLRIFIRKKCE